MAKKALILIIITLIFGTAAVEAQLRVNRVEIAPLNRAMLFFNDIPRGFESALSDDKTKVNIKFANATVVDSARITHSSGIIEDVYIQTRDGALDISVVLSDKRGYTAVPLPYSRSLMIDIFRWDQLTPAEDSYRTGLLALEDGLRIAAKKYFVKSIKSGNADAAAMLGIMLIREGEIDDAMDNLNYAVNSDTKIPDAFAGLSQAYSLKNNTEKADEYSRLFAEKTGLKSFPKLKITPISDDSSLSEESLSHLARLEDAFAGDSIYIPAIDSPAAATDTAAANIAAAPDSASADAATPAPPWYLTALTYVIIIALGLGALVVYLYLRWRQKELTKTKPPQKSKFQKSLQSAQKTARPRAAKAMDAYQKSERIHGGRPEPKADSADDENPKYQRPTPEELDRLEQQELQDMLSQIRSNIESAEEEEETAAPGADEESVETSDDDSETSAGYSPKVQLAMHLREEQHRLKKQNLSSLEKEELPTDIDKLSEIAKKLGIEKGGLETRKALENIENNEDLIEKLKSKFSSK